MKTLLKYCLIIALITNYNNSCYSQKSESRTSIIWTKERKLSKSDFKALINPRSNVVAETAVNIIIQPYTLKKGKYHYRVLAIFYKNKSWLNSYSSDVLKHEQLHFDIAELYAREMRKKIHDTQLSNGKVLESDYRKIHKQLIREYENFQKEYDSQTKHSTNKTPQKNWETIIANRLSNLEKYRLDI